MGKINIRNEINERKDLVANVLTCHTCIYVRIFKKLSLQTVPEKDSRRQR